MKKVIKRFLIIVLIILIAFIVWKASLWIRVVKMEKKINENLQRDVHYKMIMNNNTHSIEYWISDKYKKMSYSVDSESGIGDTLDIWYDVENDMIISESANNAMNVSISDEGGYYFGLNDSNFLQFFLTNGLTRDEIAYVWKNNPQDLVVMLVQNLISIDSIKTEVVDGKECYAINYFFSEYSKYIEKDTYLPVQSVDRYGDEENVTKYEFSFEPITKESLDFPNLDDYYVLVN
jgi:hypothetical protein